MIGLVREAHAIQQIARSFYKASIPAKAEQRAQRLVGLIAQRAGYILRHRHAAEQANVLEGARYAKSAALVQGEGGDVATFKMNGAAGQGVKTRHAIDEGRLARPIGADEAQNVSVE